MLSAKFGLEIELSGITRCQAAGVAAQLLGATVEHVGGGYDAYHVKVPDGRVWKFVNDSSIRPQKKVDGKRVSATDLYKVEMVSPILTYREDIDTLQKLVRALREAGGLTNSSMGIHCHLDGANHTPRSVRNFVNIIAARNDLFYKALQIEPDRMRFCKKMDEYLVERMNKKKPATFDEIKEIWYEGFHENRNNHYHSSRYCILNLHSLFGPNHTLELRSFNSTLHAGVIRAYVIFALALNHQALTQKSARSKKVQSDNEKFCMRTFLVRIGFKGDEFKNCREHLCKHLSGNAAWRFGPAA